MTGAAAENCKNFRDVPANDDATLMAAMRSDAGRDDDRGKWASRILERRHHRRVLETPESADDLTLKKMRRIHRDLVKQFDTVDFLIDEVAQNIYKLSLPGENTATDRARVPDLYIVEKDGTPKLLARESIIIGKIPKSVRTVRIFADAEGEALGEIRRVAAGMEKEQ